MVALRQKHFRKYSKTSTTTKYSMLLLEDVGTYYLYYSLFQILM